MAVPAVIWLLVVVGIGLVLFGAACLAAMVVSGAAVDQRFDREPAGLRPAGGREPGEAA